MPNRILRDYTDSFRVATLSAHAERLYVRLIQKADDFGRFYADAPLLRSLCFPVHTDVRETDIPRWLAECESAGLIVCYASRARKYLAIVEFKQRNRIKASKFPAPDGKPADWEPTFDGHNDGHLTARGGGGDGGADGGGGANPPTPRSGPAAAAPEARGRVDAPKSTGKPSPSPGVAPRANAGRPAPTDSTRDRPGSGKIAFKPGHTVLPTKLDTPAFRGVWQEWCAHRAEIRKKLTPTAVRNQLLKLAEMGEARATAAIRHSIANGWQGIFEPKGGAMGGTGAPQELKVTDSFVGTDGQWNDRHTPEELDAIMNQPDVPPMPFFNTPRTPEEAERRKSQGGDDAGR